MSKKTNTEVKRFFAPTMRRALDLVNEEMGPEAVILSSRKIDGGVEIMTSVERDLPTRGIESRRAFEENFDADLDTAFTSDSAWRSQAGIEQAASAHKVRSENNNPRITQSSTELALEIERARERMLAAKRQEREADFHKKQTIIDLDKSKHSSRSRSKASASQSIKRSQKNQADEQKLVDLQSELADMRMLLEQQLWHMSKSSSTAVYSSEAEVHSITQSSTLPGQVNMPRQFNVLNQHLSRLGLPVSLVNELLQSVNPNKRANEAWRACMATLAKKIPSFKESLVSKGGIFAFVGQTGVGKTTSIAKLAAQYLLDNGPGRVALVTTDTYRVGAFEQLKSLGKILNVPVKAVDNQNSLLTVLSSLKQFELVLIDTAGFRHGDPLLKAQLAQLDTCPSAKRLLVMSCNSQLQMMKASLHAYSSRQGIDGCVISKLDEAASLGEALGIVVEHQLPIAYTTDGQEIPKDITHATGHRLVAKAVTLMKDEWHKQQDESIN